MKPPRFLPRLLVSGLAAAALAGSLRAASPLDSLAAILAESTDAQVQLDVLRGLSAGLKGRPQVPMPAGWDRVELQLGDSANTEVRTLTQTLSLTFGSQKAQARLRDVARDPAAPADTRRAALDSLLAARAPQLPDLLLSLLADPAVRAQAIRALAGFDEGRTPGAILGIYGALDGPGRRDALTTLSSRPGFARPLLEAVAARQVPKTDLTAELVRQLRNLKDPAIQTRLTEVWGVMKDTSPDMAKEIERYRRIYGAGGSTPGNPNRGRVVFNQICAQCHHLFDFGGKVGPDITGANRGDLNYLLENILYPNAVIPNEYRQSVLALKDGRVITGIVKSQDTNALLVQAANEEVTVRQAELDKLEQVESSMMPEGLLAQLTDEQVRDLLYYLSRPGQVPLPATP